MGSSPNFSAYGSLVLLNDALVMRLSGSCPMAWMSHTDSNEKELPGTRRFQAHPLHLRFLRLGPCTILVLSLAVLLLLATRLRVVPKPSQPALALEMQSSDAPNYARQRLDLYKEMAADLDRGKPKFLLGGSTSQALKLSDLFEIRGGKAKPVLKPAYPPVRATVLHMNPKDARMIFQELSQAVFRHFSEAAIWLQDPELYHFSLYHASHHMDPVPATAVEVEEEAQRIGAVVDKLCALKIVLQRVVVTSTGVLLGLWDVVTGPDPAVIRSQLKAALPFSPTHQFYNDVILHSSFARILGLPRGISGVDEALPLLKAFAEQATSKLAGWEVEVNELWFVEELDVLALALNGRIVQRSFPMSCSPSVT